MMDNPTEDEVFEDDPTTGEELHEPPTIEDVFEDEEPEERVGVIRTLTPMVVSNE